MKIQKVLSSLYRNDEAIYLRHGLCESDIGSVNLQSIEKNTLGGKK